MLHAIALTVLLADPQKVAESVVPEEPHYPFASNRSLIFGHVVERDYIHFQIVFGLGGGPNNEGLFHAMELGWTFPGGWTVGLLHTFVQNKYFLGPDRGPFGVNNPDLIGGWMAEVKFPLLWPELEIKFAMGSGGLHDQTNGIRGIGGFTWAYGLDFHVPFFKSSGATLAMHMIHTHVAGLHFYTGGVGLGYTWF